MAIPGSSRVSVIVPVYNCERYLAQAIESVLAQTCPAYEVIVVDDGSTDASAQVARGFASPVRYEFQAHSGIGAARNRGVELARGDWLAFLDADDLWVPEKLCLQMAAFESDPTLDILFGLVEEFVSPDLDEETKQRLRVSVKPAPGHVAGTMLLRAETFMRVGLFQTDLRIAEFVDWYARAVECGLRMQVLPDVVLRRRLHQTNVGIRQRDASADYVRVLKTSLDRRRKTKSP